MHLIPYKCCCSCRAHPFPTPPPNASSIKHSIKSSLFLEDVVAAAPHAPDLALTMCCGLSKPFAKPIISRLRFIALLAGPMSWIARRSQFSSSFVRKDARKVNSLSPCISAQAFLLLSRGIWIIQKLNMFFRILKALFCYLLKPSIAVEKSGVILIIWFLCDLFYSFPVEVLRLFSLSIMLRSFVGL